MSTKGRKRKPTAQKTLSGTLRADRANPNEPKPEVVLLIAPEWLSEKAKRAFNELSVQFYAQKILTSMDAMALTLLCDQWAMYCEARDFISQNGQTFITMDKQGNETERNYPQMATINSTYNNVMKALTEFGATPASRSRTSAIEALEEDEFDKLYGSGR